MIIEPKFFLSCLLLLCMSLNLSAHEGHANSKSVIACHEKAPSSDCSYILGKKLYKGSCRVIASQTMCVRSEPIEFLTLDIEPISNKKDGEKKT